MNEKNLFRYHDELFIKARRIADYKKLKDLYMSICYQIENNNLEIDSFKSPKGPRQNMLQYHKKNSQRGLLAQKSRLEIKMKLLESSIKDDMRECQQPLG